MSSIPGNKRMKGRPNAGQQRNMKHKPIDKSILSEGVYSNQRVTHTATSLVGCIVQVEVKNGSMYEGVFKTFSPQMDIVLDLAHKIDTTNAETRKATPSKEMIIESLVFNFKNVIQMTAANVDLEYASRDTFTDGAISSKHNGETKERELTPWEGDGCDLDEGIGTSIEGGVGNSYNGWDPNEMFRTNMEKYNVKSSYDPSLPEYTTQLRKENTKDYKSREAEAERLAKEIENSDSYKKRIALENGDGDGDEEAKFSAVHRPNNENSSNKYIPPPLRKSQQQGRTVRSAGPQNASSNAPEQNPVVAKSASASTIEESEPRRSSESESTRVENVGGSPVPDSPNVGNQRDSKEGPPPKEKEVSPQNKAEANRKSSSSNPRDNKEWQELRDFSTKFKLDDGKKHGPSQISQAAGTPAGAPPPSQQAPAAQPQTPASPHPVAASPKSTPSEKSPAEERRLEQPDKRDDDKVPDAVKKSTLNPNAKEFTLNPNAKPFQPKTHPLPVATPPRPQTQSPVTMVPHPGMPQMYAIGPAGPMIPPSRFAKRAVVSVQRGEYNPAVQAAAATGQPLMAQTGPTPYGQPMPSPFMTPVPQVVQMPTGQRMMTPSVQSHSNAEPPPPGVAPPPPPPPPAPQMAPQQAPQPAAVYSVPPHHMGPPQGPHHSHPTPAHGAPHHQATPPQSQPSHISSQPQVHPAPSPVQQHQPQQGHPHPQQGHPPTSGTPQPAYMFQAHPPLQAASPHTPTSPQSNYPPQLYQFYSVSQPMQGPPHVTYMQSQAHTTVTNVSHNQHSHTHPQPGQHQMHHQQVVMMQQQGQGQPGNQHQHQPQHQHQQMHPGSHIQPAGHIQGPGPIQHQHQHQHHTHIVQPQVNIMGAANPNLPPIHYLHQQMPPQPHHPPAIQPNPHYQ